MYDLTSAKLVKADIPARPLGRPARSNPMIAIVAPVKDSRGQAYSLTIPRPDSSDEKADAKLKTAILRDLSAAATHHDVMIRRTIDAGDPAKYVLTFWIQDRPARKEKATDK